jgi:3-hydroxyisobutyrate dehydrogenase
MRIAILGTGLMGSAMADGLMQAGHEIVVYNRTPAKVQALVERGAVAVSTPAQALRETDAAIVVLPDAASVRTLLLEEDTRVSLQGRRVLNASTTKPHEIILLADELARHGACLSEVSIMVGPDALRERQAEFILGAPAEDAAFWRELLQALGTRVDLAGGIGAASKAETPVLMTSVFGIITAAYAAAAVIKLGIPRDIAEHYIAQSTPGAQYLLPNLLSRNYEECMASVDNFVVVAHAAQTAARELGLPHSVLADIADLFDQAQRRGYGALDGTSVGEVLLEPDTLSSSKTSAGT